MQSEWNIKSFFFLASLGLASSGSFGGDVTPQSGELSSAYHNDLDYRNVRK